MVTPPREKYPTMFKMFWFKIEQVTILYPFQCNAMVFIVKGKHDIVTLICGSGHGY